MDKYKKDIEEYEKVTKEQEAQNAALINKNYDAAIKQAEQSAAAQRAEAERAYADSILQADIQKELDLRDIREARANMGLSRSGLSATEQTAAVLSAGNKAAKADRQRQAAIDSLNQSLNEYRNQANLEREGKLIANQQTATDQIRAYTENKNAQAENDRRTYLSSLGLDSETLSKALNDGWTVEQATAAKNEKEATRIASLDTAYKSGQISEVVLLQAKANGLTLDDAMLLERSQQLADSENVENTALEFLGKGYIDMNTYNRAKNGEIGIAELTNIARQNAASQAASPKATDWTDALDKLLDKGSIDDGVWTIATEANMSPSSARNLQMNVDVIREIIGENPTVISKRNAIDYMNKNGFSTDDQDIIGFIVNLTSDDFLDYKKWKDVGYEVVHIGSQGSDGNKKTQTFVKNATSKKGPVIPKSLQGADYSTTTK